MIERMECGFDTFGKPNINLFNEFGLKASGTTPSFLAYHINFFGGPAPVISGTVPETHEDLWSATCDLL